MKYILYSVLFLYSLRSAGQEGSSGKPPELPRVALRANIGIPKIVSSKMYRNSFSGVVAGEAGLSYKLFSNYFFGLGYTYTYFKAQRYFRENSSVNASMQMQGGYLKLGYDHFFKPTAFTTISLNMGYQTGQYRGLKFANDSLVGKYPTQFGNAYVEPMVGIYFIVDPNFTFGAHLSYSYNFEQFNAQNIGFDKFGPTGYNQFHNRWSMSMFTLGFGFYYGIQRKR